MSSPAIASRPVYGIDWTSSRPAISTGLPDTEGTHSGSRRYSIPPFTSTANGVCAGALDELYWVTDLGPDVVKTCGRAALLPLTVGRAKPLEDGSALLAVGEIPIDRDGPAVQRGREKLSEE
jgi:hypothetical protein